ncbi:MAG: hypothetical protein Q9178_001235 [Gyalolechia marmorata]
MSQNVPEMAFSTEGAMLKLGGEMVVHIVTALNNLPRRSGLNLMQSSIHHGSSTAYLVFKPPEGVAGERCALLGNTDEHSMGRNVVPEVLGRVDQQLLYATRVTGSGSCLDRAEGVGTENSDAAEVFIPTVFLKSRWLNMGSSPEKLRSQGPKGLY